MIMAAFEREGAVRISGMCLQFIGLAATLSGIIELKASFKRPTFRDMASEWLSRFPLKAKPQKVEVGAAFEVSAAMSAHASVTYKNDPSMSVEDRLDKLFDIQNRLGSEIDSVRLDLAGFQNEQAEQSRGLERRLQKVDSGLRDHVEDIHTQGINEALAGLALMAYGILLSTASHEIFSFLGRHVF